MLVCQGFNCNHQEILNSLWIVCVYCDLHHWTNIIKYVKRDLVHHEVFKYIPLSYSHAIVYHQVTMFSQLLERDCCDAWIIIFMEFAAITSQNLIYNTITLSKSYWFPRHTSAVMP